jgi:peroxiredoxin
MIDRGDPAPSFSLIGTRGKPIDLEQTRGPRGTLLLFYPSGLRGCCGDRIPSRVVTEHIDQIRSRGYEPLAIVASERLSASEFLDSLSLPYPVVIDAENDVHSAYGAVLPGTDIPRRLTVGVDEFGKVSFCTVGGPSIENLVELLEQALAPA